MKRRSSTLRCPEDLLAELDNLCDINHFNRSSFLKSALRHYLDVLAENGLISRTQNHTDQTNEDPLYPEPAPWDRAAYVYYPDDEVEDLGLLAAESDE